MKVMRYDFVLEAQSPIAHHEGSYGNTAVAMRRKVRQSDGTWAHVPTITGDCLRHGLREAAAYAFLDAAGLLDDGQLGEAALRLLFSGGSVTGRGDAGTISMDRFREMVELCPPLALLGGCTDNRVVPGRMHVDDATLVCQEQRRFLPEWALKWCEAEKVAIDTCRAHLEEVQRVRMDPTLDPGKRKLLSDGDQVEVSKRLLASETAHQDDNAIQRDEAKSSMMPRRFERIAQGSLFYWSLTCDTYSELDVDTLHVMISAFLSNARVGGKRGTGHGQLRPIAARDVHIARPAERLEAVDITALGSRMGELFRSHVSSRSAQIKSWLQKVNS